MRLHVGRMRRYRLLQLYDCQILSILPGKLKSLVEHLYSLVHFFKLSRNFLYLSDIVIGYVVLRLKVLAQNPFHKSLYYVSSPIIDKAQKVPRRNIRPVVL